MVASAVRWTVIDTLHHRTGLPPPHLDFSRLQANLDAFQMAVEHNYRHFQFYANMIVASMFFSICDQIVNGRWPNGLLVATADSGRSSVRYLPRLPPPLLPPNGATPSLRGKTSHHRLGRAISASKSLMNWTNGTFNRLAELSELDYVDPKVSPFDLADEGLSFLQSLREVDLSQIGGLSLFPQQFAENSVFGCENGFFHKESCSGDSLDGRFRNRIVKIRLFWRCLHFPPFLSGASIMANGSHPPVAKTKPAQAPVASQKSPRKTTKS